MAAMVAGAACADPVAELAIAEMSGSSTVTWGADLDEATTGFKNETSGNFKLNLSGSGSKVTEGEGIWAELKMTLGDVIQWNNAAWNSPSWYVDTAKLHFYNFYVGTTSGDVTTGNLHIDGALSTADTAWNGDHDYWLTDVNTANGQDQGLTLGYGDNKNVNFELDFRSKSGKASAGSAGTTYAEVVNTSDGSVKWVSTATTDTEITVAADGTYKANDGYLLTGQTGTVGAVAAGADDYYTNDYALSAEFKLLSSNELANGLFASVGGSYAFNAKAMGASASAGYKLKIDDTFYVQPTVGWTMSIADVSASDTAPKQALAAGLLFGWGSTGTWGQSLYYLAEAQNNSGYQLRQTPGVGVVAAIPLAEGQNIEIVPSLWLNGGIGSVLEIPGLTVGAIADIVIPTAEGSNLGFAVTGGLKYDVKATDAVTVTPQVGVRYATKAFSGHASNSLFYTATDNGGIANNEGFADDGLLNIKGGIDVSGLINNTTFSVYYTSRNLAQSDSSAKKIGTINVAAKISF